MNRLKAIGQSIADHKIDAAVVFIVLAFLTILYFNVSNLASLKRQVAQQQQIITATSDIAKQLQTNSAQRTQQIQSLTDHIDCIVTLFGRTDRQSLKISDIQNCKIVTTFDEPVSTSNGGSSNTTTPKKTTSNPPKSPQSSPPATPPAQSPQPAPQPCSVKILFVCL